MPVNWGGGEVRNQGGGEVLTNQNLKKHRLCR
jgi:hypothetical protein